MKSPVLNDKYQLEEWLNEHHMFGECNPNAFPCIVIFDCDNGSVLEVVTYSEFQKWRYVVDDQ